jgi:hypothetical protein
MKKKHLIHALLLSFCIHLLPAQLHAQVVPQIINYQGRITVSGSNFSGTGLFKFEIVNGDGSVTYWSTGPGEVAVPVSKGNYSVLLGDTSLSNMPSFETMTDTGSNADIRLRVTFNDGINGPQLLTPNQRFAAVPFAFSANFAKSAAFAQNAQNAGTLTDGTSNVLLGGGYITLDGTSHAGPPHDILISPNGDVSIEHRLSTTHGASFGGNIQIGGSTTVTGGLTAYGVCSFGDTTAHSITSVNNVTAQGGVIGGYGSFNGDTYVNGNMYAHNFNVQSDRTTKENFVPVNNREILEKVASLPISRWNFKQDTATPHIGPMAQDFYAAFNVGADDKHIGMVDEGGVALAAVQGLSAVVEEKDAKIKDLERRLSEMEAKFEHLTNQGGAK